MFQCSTAVCCCFHCYYSKTHSFLYMPVLIHWNMKINAALPLTSIFNSGIFSFLVLTQMMSFFFFFQTINNKFDFAYVCYFYESAYESWLYLSDPVEGNLYYNSIEWLFVTLYACMRECVVVCIGFKQTPIHANQFSSP